MHRGGSAQRRVVRGVVKDREMAGRSAVVTAVERALHLAVPFQPLGEAPVEEERVHLSQWKR